MKEFYGILKMPLRLIPKWMENKGSLDCYSLKLIDF